MAFNPSNFSYKGEAPFSLSNSNKVWDYSTTDDVATVTVNGYFDATLPLVRVSDYIIADCSDGIYFLYVGRGYPYISTGKECRMFDTDFNVH